MAAETERGATTAGIQVIARAAAILRILGATDRGMSLTSLATAAALPRSTTHRIVCALAAEHLVAWDPRRGQAELGPGLVSLALSRRRRLSATVHPHLEALSRRVGETVDLVVLRGETVLFVDQIIGRQVLVVSALGAVLPAHCTAGGKALLAALPPGEVERLLPAELQAFTPATVTDRAVLQRELAVVQVSRVAYDREEHTEGVSAVGAVIRNAWGEVAAVTIPVPTQRFAAREEEFAVALLETCDELDDALTKA
jgi:DNA-binding IclR family transcriptional regulator